MTNGCRPFIDGRLIRVLPLAGVMAVIFVLSHMPGNDLALPRFYGADKLAHCIAYGTLAATAIFASKPLSIRMPDTIYRACIVSFCFAYGVSDEFHQSFIPGRTVSGFDVLADTTGAIAVVLLWCRLDRSNVLEGA